MCIFTKNCLFFNSLQSVSKETNRGFFYPKKSFNITSNLSFHFQEKHTFFSKKNIYNNYTTLRFFFLSDAFIMKKYCLCYSRISPSISEKCQILKHINEKILQRVKYSSQFFSFERISLFET